MGAPAHVVASAVSVRQPCQCVLSWGVAWQRLVGGICALLTSKWGNLKPPVRRESRTASETAVMATILMRLCVAIDSVEDTRVRVRQDRGGVNRSGALMKRLVAEIGIERAMPDDLRRTALTTITRLRFGRDAMERIANHKTSGDRHLRPARLRGGRQADHGGRRASRHWPGRGAAGEQRGCPEVMWLRPRRLQK